MRGWTVVVKGDGDVEGGYLKQGVARAHSYGEVKADVVAGMFVELKCSSHGVETLKCK